MKKSHVTSAITKASHDTSRLLSAHLRTEARKSGWPDHIVSTMHVTYGKDGFKNHVHPEHRAEARNLEYGTTSSQPTAAIRRFKNRTRQAEPFFIKRLAAHLGGMK